MSLSEWVHFSFVTWVTSPDQSIHYSFSSNTINCCIDYLSLSTGRADPVVSFPLKFSLQFLFIPPNVGILNCFFFWSRGKQNPRGMQGHFPGATGPPQVLGRVFRALSHRASPWPQRACATTPKISMALGSGLPGSLSQPFRSTLSYAPACTPENSCDSPPTKKNQFY